MKILNNLFYIGVFGILLTASILFPSWIMDGYFDEVPFIGACVGLTIYVAFGAAIYMFVNEGKMKKKK